MSQDSEDRFESLRNKITSRENPSSSGDIHASPIEGKVIQNLKLLKSLIRGERARLDQFVQTDLTSDTDKETSIQKLQNKIINQFFEMETPLLAGIEIPKKLQEECFDLIVQGWRKKITSEYSQTLTLVDVKFSKDSFRAFVVALSFSVTLKALRLDHCRLHEKESEMIAVFLKVHPTITVFHADDNPIKDEGFLHLAHALKDNETLIHLSLNKTRLTDESMGPVIELLKTGRYQSFSLKENKFSEGAKDKMKEVALECGEELILD